jgi:hypothetical protein
MMENSLGLHNASSPIQPGPHDSRLNPTDPTSPRSRIFPPLVSNPLSHITQAACQAVTLNVHVRIPAKTHLELANTSTAVTDSRARSKKNRTKSPEDATEQVRRSEESEKMIEPADGDAEDFEDDPSAWK